MSRQLLDKHRLLSLGLLTFSHLRMQPKATHQLLRDYLNSESLMSFNSFLGTPGPPPRLFFSECGKGSMPVSPRSAGLQYWLSSEMH
jgi:hypothetical protein